MQILKFTKSTKPGFLQGFADVGFSTQWGRFIIYGVSVFSKNGARWCVLPQKPTGEKTPEGKDKYFAICRFDERETHEKFQLEFFKALDAFENTTSVHAKVNGFPQHNESNEVPF